MKRISIWAASATLFASAFVGLTATGAAAISSKVLILDTSVSGGATSVEGTEVTNLGLTPTVVNAATWAGMTTADFADYRAIILGDPTCSTSLS
jgi:hypothetical protein